MDIGGRCVFLNNKIKEYVGIFALYLSSEDDEIGIVYLISFPWWPTASQYVCHAQRVMSLSPFI